MAPPRRNTGNGSGNYEGTPAGNAPEMTMVLQTLTTIMQQQQQAQAQHVVRYQQDSEHRLLRDFKALQPSVFKGDTTPHEASRWIIHVEKILDTMDVTSAKRVALATFQLEGQAEFWWQSVKRRRGPDEPPMEWQEFQEAFFEKYFPEPIRDQLEKDFMDLKQEGMTVIQYESRFDELSRYAPHIIDTEARRAKRFEQGLRPELKKQVVPHRLRDYGELLLTAIAAEGESVVPNQVGGKRDEGHQAQHKHKGINCFALFYPFFPICGYVLT